MTEPEAFKWIQRAAMDRRTTMKRVAEVVLETLDHAGRRVTTAFPDTPFRPDHTAIRQSAFPNITHHGHALAMFYPKHRRRGRSALRRRMPMTTLTRR